MGGKSNYKPVAKPQIEQDLYDSGSDGDDVPEDASGLGYKVIEEPDEDEGEEAEPHGQQASQPSQQQGIGDYLTQLPLFEEEKSEAAEAELFPEGHTYSVRDIPQAVESTSKKVHVTLLVWDLERIHGQNRTLKMSLVNHYVARLKQQPPRRMIRILGKNLNGM